ncbi:MULTISPECIES: hypothetical protein [Hymenobacter]|uniref:Uncharacterized protein n=1 Tax=Hymenobacter mucosus TaxID=1411120 RepID=A0A238V993_9BACT|nr:MULTISPECIES: hypothetical protein [Hymenobacter]SNR30099.1 hypothetical protein SAMN06269173_101231 [Hymenobacter mucosus]
MQRFYFALLLGFISFCLDGCSEPTSSTSAYARNPTISDARGRPRNSTTFYFPAADSSYPFTNSVEYPPSQLLYASCNLLYFGAPVLSNYYLNTDVYRFLWLRSFNQPVLLTLRRSATGGSIRTQFLDKPNCGIKLVTVQFIPPKASAQQVKQLEQELRKRQADLLQQQRIAKINRPPVHITSKETTRSISPQQWQQFEQLLAQSRFQQLPPFEAPTGAIDGASWLLESHQASGYHMVFRHEPNAAEGFRRACEYLLDLSSARAEERY